MNPSQPTPVDNPRKMEASPFRCHIFNFGIKFFSEVGGVKMSLKDYTYNDYRNIVVNEIPLIDFRAPVEFEKGVFINAFNLPIMNNEEREKVGICYKEKGNEEAVKLGHQLVSGDIKKERVQGWVDFLTKNPNALIYCFRGGQRSQIAQEWIYEATGIMVPRLAGGYKEFRNYLISSLEPENIKAQPIIISGYTGSGKTIFINEIEETVDLEGLANHRGSAFGKHVNGQPTQITFDNNLAYKIIQNEEKGHKIMILEDEGRNVGRCYLPKSLAQHFADSPHIILEVSFFQRVNNTLEEYVIHGQKEHQYLFGYEEGLAQWKNHMEENFLQIKRKLGGELHQRILDSFNDAYEYQLKNKDFDYHKNWIEYLLKEYYDPMYEYQLKRIQDKIIFKGTEKEILNRLDLFKREMGI